MKLSILFDQPYWIAVLEDERDGALYAAKHIFGAEPSDQQVYEFVLNEAAALLAQMTIGVPVEHAAARSVGYKRMIRAAKRETQARGISTQAQAAIKQQIEQNKQSRRRISRAERKAERERKRQIAREKAKAKQRGH